MSAATRPLLLIKSGGAQAMPEWRAAFHEYAPEIEVRQWDDPQVDPDAVHYVLVWQPDPGRIAQYPNLKAILSSAAGVDHILADPLLPPTLPIVRMVTAETRQRMAEFSLMASLMLLKDMPRIIHQQQQRLWQEFTTPRTVPETRVGIMGLGALGEACAELHARMGFVTAGWARSPRDIKGVRCYAGAAALPEFLQRTDILICLLPDTPDTRHIINADLMRQLPPGAAIINVGRGTHLQQDDLLAALASGHISRALLDVFENEPLPADVPLWQHPHLIITPHSAATPARRERARQAAQTMRDIAAGAAVAHLYDRQRGY